MTTILQTRESEPSHASRRDPEKRPWSRSTDVPLRMEIRRALLLLSIAAVMATLSVMAKSQSLSYSESSPVTAATSVSGQAVLVYVRPTARTKLNNYIFDAYGPYPIAGAAVAAGISQWSNAPPEWNQLRCMATDESCRDIGLDGASRRRWSSRFLFFGACRALCRHHDCCLWLVPKPLRCKGCISNGQLRPVGICGREPCAGVFP